MRQAGVDHFIQKPYALDEMAKTIQGLIETAEGLCERDP